MADQESTLQPGDVIAEYRIEQVLGSGSFGVTYLAQDTQLARKVAIKEYMPVVYARRDSDGTVGSRNIDTAATFEWGLERFSEEARTLAQFNHPNIVRVLRLVAGHNGTAYIAMEYLEGTNLETLVEREGPLPPERFLSIFRQILDGCESIHRIGILHRDIKPANIVIRNDTPVLIDFGAARDLAVQQKAGFSALVTDGFSPLEQYSREIRQTEATDIYALAATGYFLLTGRIPPPSAARSGGDSLPPAVSVGAGLLPDDILRAIDWGLMLSMAERPATIGEWRAAMPSLDARETPYPRAIDETAPKAAISRRALLIAGGGILVAGGAAFALLGGDSSLNGSARPLRLEWTKRFARLSSEPYAAIAAVPQGAIVAAHRLGEDGNDYLLALRLDDAGSVAATFASPEAGSRGHAILPAADGGAYVGGVAGRKSMLARLDKDWKQLWSRDYGEGQITSIMPRDGGVIAGLAGLDDVGTGKLLYVAEDGALQNELTVADRSTDTVQGIIQLADRGIAVLGMRLDKRIVGAETRNVASLWVARFSADGGDLGRIGETGMGYANGWRIAEANGDLYVTGRTSPDAQDSTWRMLLMRIGGNEKKWVRWDYEGLPSSGRGLAAVGSGGDTSLYVGGWAGEPHASRLAQIGPDGDLVWDWKEQVPAGVSNGISGLSLREDGTGFAVGLSAENQSTLHLTVSRLA